MKPWRHAVRKAEIGLPAKLATRAMSPDERQRLHQVSSLCRKALEELGGAGSFRLRVMLQMLLLELERAVQDEADNGGDGDA